MMNESEREEQREKISPSSPSSSSSSSSSSPSSSPQSAATSTRIAPYDVQSVAAKILPYSSLIVTAFKKLLPLFHHAHQIYLKVAEILRPYHPEESFPMFLGFVLAFFGANFSMLIAALEAFKMCGWESSKKHFQDLYDDYLLVKDESAKDDLVDDNNDGIADVKQITDQQLLIRKARLALKSCHPEKISDALAGIYTGFVGVVAVLKVQFSSTITLGAKIGDLTSHLTSMVVAPVVEFLIPREYHKWIPVILKYTCKGVGVWVAWWAMAVTTSVHSALRGGEQFAKGLVQYCSRTGYLPPIQIRENTIAFSAIMYLIAIFGFYWQLTHYFSLPFPLNILLFPFTLAEGFLRYYVTYS